MKITLSTVALLLVLVPVSTATDYRDCDEQTVNWPTPYDTEIDTCDSLNFIRPRGDTMACDVWEFKTKQAYESCTFDMNNANQKCSSTSVTNGQCTLRNLPQGEHYYGCKVGGQPNANCNVDKVKVEVEADGSTCPAKQVTTINWKFQPTPNVITVDGCDASIKFDPKDMYDHDVYEFKDKQAFDDCDFGTGRAELKCSVTSVNAGSCILKDLKEGEHYYGCSVGRRKTGGHCRRGNMKVKVTVTPKGCPQNRQERTIQWNYMPSNAVSVGGCDTLKFRINDEEIDNHDVWEFNDKTAFDNCDFLKANRKCTQDEVDSGKCIISGLSEGKHYFGCSMGRNYSHCKYSTRKQKLEVTVGPKTCPSTTPQQAVEKTIEWKANPSPAKTTFGGCDTTVKFDPKDNQLRDVWEFDDKTAFDSCDFTRADLVCTTRTVSKRLCILDVEDLPKGKHYFGDSLGGGNADSHCKASRMKVKVNVRDGGITPPPCPEKWRRWGLCWLWRSKYG